MSKFYDKNHLLYLELLDDSLSKTHGTYDFGARHGSFYDPYKREPWHIPELAMPSSSDLQKQNLSFDEICDLVAQDIVNFTNQSNREVIINYSGGVDSTTVLTALLKNQINKDKLTILLSKESIEEYPGFYQDIIYNKLYHLIHQPSHLLY